LAHAVRETVNYALFPYLHFGPIAGDSFGEDAHRSEVILAHLGVAFGRGEQGFKRNAAAIETDSSGWSWFNKSDMSSQLSSAYGRNIATWSRAQNENVDRRGDISDNHDRTFFLKRAYCHCCANVLLLSVGCAAKHTQQQNVCTTAIVRVPPVSWAGYE